MTIDNQTHETNAGGTLPTAPALDIVYRRYDLELTRLIDGLEREQLYYSPSALEPEYSAEMHARYRTVIDLLIATRAAGRYLFS